MDSLVANYASSDEDEELSSSSTSKPISKSGLHLPPPKSSDARPTSLPPPKLSDSRPTSLPPSTKTHSIFGSLPPPKSSSVFNSIPPPKSHQKKPKNSSNTSLSDSVPKRVIQFKPPLDPSVLKTHEEDKEENGKIATKKSMVSSENSSSKGGLSALLPPPKNSFGVGPTSSSGGRRSIVETDVPAANKNLDEGNSRPGTHQEHEIVNSGSWVSSEENSGLDNVGVVHENYDHYGNQQYWEGTGEQVRVDGSFPSSAGVGADQPELLLESIGRLVGKRGRSEIPTNIIEVKQDQLINNRPREDQVKLTGIAFGPSYQPVSSVKGKPSKLHKRKHQIGSLYFDMKQKETELAERRSKGFLTKAETQAKYGW